MIISDITGSDSAIWAIPPALYQHQTKDQQTQANRGAPIRECTHGVPSGPFSTGCHPGFRFSQVGRFRSMGAAIPLNLAPDTGFQSEMRSSSPTLLSFIAWSISSCSIVGVSWGRLSQRGCAFSVPQPGFFTLWEGRACGWFPFCDRDICRSLHTSSTTHKTSRHSNNRMKRYCKGITCCEDVHTTSLERGEFLN